MSKDLGEKALKKLVNSVLEKSPILAELKRNYRDKLNSQYHVLDLRYRTLLVNNLKKHSLKKQEVFNKAYGEFIEAVIAYLSPSNRVYGSIDDIKVMPKSTFFIKSTAMLISPSFGSSRENVTAISNTIKTNRYFGISNRARTLAEIMREENKSQKELEAEGRLFDRRTGRELELNTNTGKLEARRRILSKVDLGHGPGAGLGRESPLKYQLTESATNTLEGALSASDFSNLEFLEDTGSLDITAANTAITASILNKLAELSEIQAECLVSFKNEIPEKLAELTGDKGFLLLTLQLFNVNNDISVKESAIRNSLLREIKEEIRKVVLQIPGSNTMEKDAVEAVKQRVMEGISGKGSSSKLQKHAKLDVAVKKTSKSNKPVAITTGLKIVTNTAKKSTRSPPIRNTQGRFTSLASLQTLLNLALAQQIQQNMGTGTRRDVLNYRTGRLAESAQVTNLSQSREGMITAFYTYMRNPYGTFSEGGAQGSPKTRDPKLLISKSIREVLATQVNNRLRAVLA